MFFMFFSSSGDTLKLYFSVYTQNEKYYCHFYNYGVSCQMHFALPCFLLTTLCEAQIEILPFASAQPVSSITDPGNALLAKVLKRLTRQKKKNLLDFNR